MKPNPAKAPPQAVCALLCWVLLSSAPAAQAAFSRSDIKRFETTLRPVVEQNGTVGMAVGLRLNDSVWTAGFGTTSKSAKIPADPDTLFEIGSITKVFTGLLLADSAERRIVRLDDPLSKYLPKEAAMPHAFGPPIKLVDLITHRSGLPRMPSNIRPADHSDPFADYTVPLLYEFLHSCQVSRAPGDLYEYSNLGAGLLGHVLSLAANQPYETLLTERIFQPLGMHSTSLQITGSNPKNIQRAASVHDAEGRPVKPFFFDALAGCGAGRSSVNDLMRFIDANLGLLDLGPDQKRWTRTLDLARRVHAKENGPTVGLAWHHRGDPGACVWHNGATFGSWSWMGLNVEKKIGVVVLTNTSRSIDDVGQALIELLGELAQD